MSTKKCTLLELGDSLDHIIDQVEFLALALQADVVSDALDARAYYGLLSCVADISQKLETCSENLNHLQPADPPGADPDNWITTEHVAQVFLNALTPEKTNN